MVFTITTGELPQIIDKPTSSEEIVDEPPIGEDPSNSGESNGEESSGGSSGETSSGADGFDQGGSGQGGSDQGSSDQGGSDQGGSDQGGSDQGSSDQGGSDQGGSDQGGSDQGSSDQGGSDGGGSDQGGPGGGDPDVVVKNMDELNGFVWNDIFFPFDRNGLTSYQPNEPQHEVEIIFSGPDVQGWAVSILFPGANHSWEMVPSYENSLKFSITTGEFEFQVYCENSSTVYYTRLLIDKSGVYTPQLSVHNPFL